MIKGGEEQGHLAPSKVTPGPRTTSPESGLTRIRPSRGWLSPDLREVWAYSELLYFLIWRDVKVRYKQTAIGASWAILQPLATTLVFTFVFQTIGDMPSDGLPYPIFTYVALLPWNLFAGALNRSVTSLVSQSNLITKVYFPRLIVPLSATMVGLVDLAISFTILIGMLFWYRIVPTWGVILLPIFVLLALNLALAIGLWLSALNVRYRDIGHTIPFVIQLWMFASPIGYPVSQVPEKWRAIYYLNPMAGVIEAFRWALLGKQQPDFGMIAVSALVVLVLLFGGVMYFKRMEETFADVV